MFLNQFDAVLECAPYPSITALMTLMSNSDQIQRILFDELDIRGAVAGLEDSYHEALHKHGYPLVIRKVLGELMAAAALLSTNLKFEGRLILQVAGKDAVKVLMAECTDQQELRAIARFDGELPEEASFHDLVQGGQMAITIQPKQGQRYQGVVPLEGETLSQCLEAYFSVSEQLPTQILLAADGEKAAGMMVQVLPVSGGDNEDWQRISHLTSTLKDDELLQLDNETLLYRLFHEETCRLFEADPVTFRCDCSRERSAASLRYMSREELEQIIEEEGKVAVNCQFCNSSYAFGLADLDQVFAAKRGDDPASTLH